ncbi:MAG TPA: M23 family metallopeptidase [bacterium]|nr:M23 family metallopeptidase [bacterium]
MDPFLRRVYLTVAGVLVVLWSAMALLTFDRWAPSLAERLRAPAASPASSLQDFTPFLKTPGIRYSLYHPQSGETFATLAKKFDLLETTLRSLNQANDESQPKAGSPIFIPSKDGIYHLVHSGQGLADISRAYGIPLRDILIANQKRDDSDLHAGDVLYLPGASYLGQKDPRWVALMSLGAQKGFLKPTTGRFADGFGYRIHPITHKLTFHEGLDLAPGFGHAVVAAQDGKVVFANLRAGYGRLIILDHGAGLTSYYAHLDEILVKPNQWVKRGQLIGKVGKTGRVTGPHLHFEVRLYGKPQNPLLYLVQ